MKAAICDDEEVFRNQICDLLVKAKKGKEIDLTIDVYESGAALLESIQQYNVVFLDIEMEDMSGIEVARRIKEQKPSIEIIFISSHSSYVTDAFSVEAFQFLTKPINHELFGEIFERVISKFKTQQYHYILESEGTTKALSISEISTIEVDKRILIVYCGGIGYKMKGSFKDEEKKLSSFGFRLAYRGILVNIEQIKEIGLDYILLYDGRQIPLSRNYRQDIISRFTIYLSRRTL